MKLNLLLGAPPILLARRFPLDGVTVVDLVFWCPGCRVPHEARLGGGQFRFTWSDGRPSLEPQLVSLGGGERLHEDGVGDPLCVSRLFEGRLVFHRSCEHALRGQTVELPPLPLELLAALGPATRPPP